MLRLGCHKISNLGTVFQEFMNHRQIIEILLGGLISRGKGKARRKPEPESLQMLGPGKIAF